MHAEPPCPVFAWRKKYLFPLTKQRIFYFGFIKRTKRISIHVTRPLFDFMKADVLSVCNTFPAAVAFNIIQSIFNGYTDLCFIDITQPSHIWTLTKRAAEFFSSGRFKNLSAPLAKIFAFLWCPLFGSESRTGFTAEFLCIKCGRKLFSAVRTNFCLFHISPVSS